MDHQKFTKTADRLGQAAAKRRRALAEAEQTATDAIERGDRPRAVAIIEPLLIQRPDAPRWWHELAYIRLQDGDNAAAATAWQRALRCDLQDLQLLHRIGQALEAAGHSPAEFAQRAWDAEPGVVAGPGRVPLPSQEFRTACLEVLRGNPAAALPVFKEVFLSQPANAQATRNLSFLLERLGKHGQAQCILAVKRLAQGRARESIEAFDAAPDADSHGPAFLDSYLNALRRAGQERRAVDIAASVDPGSCPPAAYMEWARALMDLHLYAAATETLRRGAAIHDNEQLRQQADLMVPPVPASQAVMEKLHARARRAIHALADSPLPQEPSKLAALETTLQPNFLLPYLGTSCVEEARAYGRFARRIIRRRYPQHDDPPPARQRGPGERIRIGYATSFATRHVVMHYFAGWLQQANREAFEIHLFPLATETSLETGYLSGRVDVFHPPANQSEVAARQIRESELDVLIYPGIGMDSLTFRLAAMRLAPVQCVAGGHPVTTGLETLDYFLSTTGIEPPDAATHYTERLVTLPGTGISLARPAQPSCSRSRADFGLATDEIVYLSPQSLFKYLPRHDDVFARIAQSVGKAVFVFVESDFPAWTRTFIRRLQTVFKARGLDPARHLRFFPKQDYDSYLSLTAAGDVFLDPLGGFSAGMTAVDALACGVPIVTLPGALMRTRASYAMLRELDIKDTVAADINDYVRLAARLGEDADLRADVSRRIHERSHLLFDDLQGVRGLEAFYRWASGSARPGDETLFQLWPEAAPRRSPQ